MIETIDIKKLKAKALESCCKESYLVLRKSPFCKIGAGARIDDNNDMVFSIDININLCPGSSNMDKGHMEKGIAFANVLQEHGYEISCHEGQITCELDVAEKDLNSEFNNVLAILSQIDITI